MSLTLDLSEKIIVVCGSGAGGIGGATCELLAAAGATVFAVDYTRELVDETCDIVRAKGATAMGMVVNLRDRADTARVIPEAHKSFGRIDGVINVAGGSTDEQWREAERIPDDMMDSVFALNFDYVFRTCSDAAKVMIEAGRGGAMVNIASISGLASAPYHAMYGAAKAGVVSISKTLGVEWKRHNIRVNAVSPGVTKSQRVLSRKSNITAPPPDETFGRRAVETSEIASMAVVLMSDWASGVTAQNIIVDAGMTSNFAAFPNLAGLQTRLYRDPA